jgi:hypothetical protein
LWLGLWLALGETAGLVIVNSSLRRT